MKLREIFRYEIDHRRRSASTWIYAVIFLFIGFAMIHVDADGNSPKHVNAASRLALLSIMAGMVGMLVSAAFFGDAGIRDYDARMDSLLFTSPIRKLDYLGGRFLAALTANAILLLAIPLGQAIATLMLDVQARKLRADSLGKEAEIPMNDFVEIGVFGDGKAGALGEPLYLERQRIRSGKQVIVAREPKRAGIDPYDKIIDRERGDNMRALTPASSG